jgi:hypothetical protein
MLVFTCQVINQCHNPVDYNMNLHYCWHLTFFKELVCMKQAGKNKSLFYSLGDVKLSKASKISSPSSNQSLSFLEVLSVVSINLEVPIKCILIKQCMNYCVCQFFRLAAESCYMQTSYSVIS